MKRQAHIWKEITVGDESAMQEFGKISEQLNIELLQSIQDKCSKAMGLAFVTVDYRGRPITKYSGFTDHCALGRELQGFSEMCEQCDAHGGLHAAITGQPYMYRCHADLVDFAVPLVINDSYVGSVMGGQVRLTDGSERELDHIIPRGNWNKGEAMETAYGQLREMTYDKLLASVQLVQEMFLHTIQNGLVQKSDAAGELDLPRPAEEQSAGPEAEAAPPDHKRVTFWQQEGTDQFFFIMNLITQLAFQEKADRTGTVALDFADIIRYTGDTDRKLSSLGEELTYIEAYLRIQKAWWGDVLDYSISIPKPYWGVNCPFLIFRPMIELVLQSFKGVDKQRKIDIFAEESDKDLLILVQVNSESVTPDEMESRADIWLTREQSSLRNLNRSLKRIVGKRCELSTVPRNDGAPGYAFRLRLPLKWK